MEAAIAMADLAQEVKTGTQSFQSPTVIKRGQSLMSYGEKEVFAGCVLAKIDSSLQSK